MAFAGLRRQQCLVATEILDKGEGLGLRSPCGSLVSTSFVSLCHQHCLVATALLDYCEGLGLHSSCSSLVPTLFISHLLPLIQRHQRLLLPSRDRRHH